jgi:type II secretory pathway pseudopilin PulG
MTGPVAAVGNRRAFSLVEAAVVLVVLGVLSTVVVLTAAPGDRAAESAAGRTTLERVLAAADQVRDRHGGLVEDLEVYATTIETVTVVAGVPQDREVSLEVEGQALGAAVSTGDGTCFLVRRDWAAAPGEPLVVRAMILPGVSVPCTGTTALAVAGDPERGRTWEMPVLVTE